MKHRSLVSLLHDAAAGRFPSPDGGWHRVPPWRDGIGGVVAFTGHAVVAVDDGLQDAELEALQPGGYGRAHDPHVLLGLAKVGGWIDCLDQVFVVTATGPSRDEPLAPRPDLANHPRVVYARERRDDVRVFGRSDRASETVATVGIGTAGLHEVSFELDPAEQGRGLGTALVRQAVSLVPAGELVVVAAAPGNAASIRSILRAGLLPVGSIQLFERPQ